MCCEDTLPRIQDRLYKLPGEAPDNLRFAQVSAQIGNGLETQITDYLRDYPETKLVIIDTLQKVRCVSNSNNFGMYARDYADISALKEIADRSGIAILLVHHPRKQQDNSDPFNSISGTNGIAGAMDTNLLLRRESRTGDTAVLSATGRGS